MTVSITLAFIAGFAFFLSLRVFALVPAYIGNLGGRSAATEKSGGIFGANRLVTSLHDTAFVMGFSLIFIALGSTTSALGIFLDKLELGQRGPLPEIGGIFFVFLGLQLTRIFKSQMPDYDSKPQTKFGEGKGLLSSFLIGKKFHAGWSPWVGPVLGAIHTLAMNQDAIFEGIMLLAAYSPGLAYRRINR